MPDADDSLAVDVHPALDDRIREPVEHEPIHEQDAHRGSNFGGWLLDVEYRLDRCQAGGQQGPVGGFGFDVPHFAEVGSNQDVARGVRRRGHAEDRRDRWRVRRVAVLMNYLVDYSEAEARVAAFRALLHQAGWIEGQNIQIDFHWGAGGPDHMRSAVAAMLGLSPDVIVSSGTPATKAAQDGTRSIPIVFANVADPVGEGIVARLAKRVA